MRKQQLQVTLKDFATNVSVERPNLIIFQITMEVLHEVHTDFTVPYQINPMGSTSSNQVTPSIQSVIDNSISAINQTTNSVKNQLTTIFDKGNSISSFPA